MEDNRILIPVIVQIALTLWLYIDLAIAKSQALRLGLVNEDRRALHNDAWPDSVLQINNCIRNQFEVPILFYLLMIILWCINGTNTYIHVLAWVFVLSRIVHAAIHTGSNYVPLRRIVFAIGCFILIGITLFSAYQILTTS
jgi:hypothetical protein